MSISVKKFSVASVQSAFCQLLIEWQSLHSAVLTQAITLNARREGHSHGSSLLLLFASARNNQYWKGNSNGQTIQHRHNSRSHTDNP
jgi:hypothetical protein